MDVLGQMHGKLTEETLVYGSEPVRVEGGQIVFEEMRNRPFSTLAVPDHNGFKNEKDEVVVGVIGISNDDLLKTFLQFAAVNLMILKKGQKPAGMSMTTTPTRGLAIRRNYCRTW